MKRFLALATAITLSTGANAYDSDNLVIGLGAHDAFEEDNGEVGAGIEWRGKRFDSEMIGFSNISPLIGVTVDFESDAFLYGGFLYDWNIDDRWSLVPSLAVGLYREGDDGIDLGGVVNFRSSLELNYAMTPETRLGLNLAHISNLGIYSDNPGSENVTVNYSLSY